MTIKKLWHLYIMLVIGMFVPLAFPAISYSEQAPLTVVEVFHYKTNIAAIEPEVTNTDVLLVPNGH